MSRSLLRSVLELRTPVTRLPPTFLLPIRARALSTTAQKIEPALPLSSTSTRTGKPSPIPTEPTSSPNPGATPPSPPPATAESIAQLLPLLRAQPGHYVTAHIHGFPYLVTAGDEVRLPFRMPGVNPGDVLRLDRASVLGSRDYTLRGSPWVDGSLFECRAVVLGVETEPLRVKVKTKRRNRRSRRVHSKHRYTVLRISELKVLGP